MSYMVTAMALKLLKMRCCLFPIVSYDPSFHFFCDFTWQVFQHLYLYLSSPLGLCNIVELHSVTLMSCGATPMQGNGAPETYAAPPSALLGPRRRPLGMQGKLSRLVARIEEYQISSTD